MAIYFENRVNKETGNKAFKRAIVRNIDGLFYGMFEKDYGYGNIDIKTETDKLSLDLIKDIKAEIIKQCGGEISVSIINIIKMDE